MELPKKRHLQLLGKAQLGLHILPQKAFRVTEAADRHLHLGTQIFQGIPHTCSTPEAFHAVLEQPRGLFPCSLFPVFIITAEQRNISRNRKRSHDAGKKRESTNAQAEAVNKSGWSWVFGSPSHGGVKHLSLKPDSIAEISHSKPAAGRGRTLRTG